MKEFLKSFFGASRKEVRGLSLLILIIISGLIVLEITKRMTTHNENHLDEDAKILDSLVFLLENNLKKPSGKTSQVKLPFKFNPNIATREEFLSLGFSEKISNRLINYRNKGGVFRVKNDLYKIYGIDSALVDTLYSFIDLPVKIKRVSTPIQQSDTNSRQYVKYAKPQVELPDFDINSADTSMLQTIKGIGSVLSSRIIEYRDKLGGFIDVNQLYEVYNLDSIVVERLINKIYLTSSYQPKLIKINMYGEKELAAHPYITWKQSRLIVAFRNQHGNFTTESDLLKVYGVDEILIEKIRPYLDWTHAN